MKTTIGIFDSGVGGLTVLHAIQKSLPYQDLVYVGDNAHCPYGDKTKEQLLEYAINVVEYFIGRGIKIIVLACNTTSANTLEDLRKKYQDVLFIGVIDSTVQTFLKKDLRNVLVIGTKATIESNKYEQLILDYQKDCHVTSLATPKFVPAIESKASNHEIENIAYEYLNEYQDNIDSIILGCTHYPMIMDQIKNVLGDICYISSSESVSKDIKYYLESHHLISQHPKNIEIYTTGNVDDFVEAGKTFYDFSNTEVQALHL